MDINEKFLKEEVSTFVSNLQKLLPRKKELILVEPAVQPRLTRLSHVHAEAKSVFPKCFLGAKLVILRQIMDKVKLVQNYNFGKSKESYKCYPHLIDNELQPKRATDGLLLESSGSATATYNEVIDGAYEMRLMSKIKDMVSSETEVCFQKENQKTAGSITCSMRDVDPNTLKMVTQWMYQVVPEFSFGTEISFRPLSYPPKPDMTVSARYERPSFVLSSTVSKVGFQLCLFKQFAPDLRIATILNEGSAATPANVTFALHKSYNNGAEMKIFVDSQKCGGFTIEKDVYFYETPNDVRVCRMICSTVLDRQRRVRFGFGVNLDF